jgi:hypothetical protein
MKTFAVLLLFAATSFAQDKPASKPTKPEPTVVQLEQTIKEQRAQLADLNIKLLEAQAQLIQVLGQQAKQEQAAAQADLKTAPPK